MTSYTAQFEIDVSPTENRVLSLMDALARWSAAVGRSEYDRLEATVTFEAANAWKAMAYARETFDGLVPDPIRFEVLPTAVFDRRSEESAGESQPVSVTEAAAQLNLTRQRVLQMIHENKIDATRVGHSFQINDASLRRLLRANLISEKAKAATD